MFPLVELHINYKYFIHTHSHIALLGWVYLGLTALVTRKIKLAPKGEKSLGSLYWFTQFTLIGMLFSFPFQGYALFSIIFSTLFLFASYRFAYLVFRYASPNIKQRPMYWWVRLGLLCLIISSLGPWSLGYLMKTFGPTSVWYRHAIYFYLHFLYNGFFIATLFGLWFKSDASQNFKHKLSFWLFALGTMLSTLLSFVWDSGNLLLVLPGLLGVILLMISLFFMVKTTKTTRKPKPIVAILLGLYVCKLIFQFVGGLPLHDLQLNRSLIIAYLHFVFLGPISLTLIHLVYREFNKRIPSFFLWFYALGFLGSEFLLAYKGVLAFFQGPSLVQFDFVLLSFSTIIVLGIISLLYDNKVNK
ncbi:hypothetical protein B7P33_05945 [Sediminicola luteus]|uniref:Uncharacterized protein n=1 Tax=Sediminicola luteus TaxID=319238 RepID=A0A2A4GAE0_9FLAO|nr:hypothetical protein B7P33_05945 [Sediminicola luteus]